MTDMSPEIAKAIMRVDSGCWLWTGYIGKNGYGSKMVRHPLNPSGWQPTTAHRFVYEALVGPIPEGMDLDHLCRVRHCVNPEHLEPVTRSENLRRAASLITHCPQGHAYNSSNLLLRPSNGYRQCRACGRERAKQYYLRRKGSNNA